MKKIIFLLFSSIVMGLNASALTINCTAGGLNLAAVGTDIYTSTDLKITGTMDARDFKFIQYYIPMLANLDLSSVTIAAYTGSSGTMAGSYVYAANAIPPIAFTLIPPNNYTKNLTTITLPSNVISIENQAFYGCTGLTTVNIPSTVLTTIITGAFYGCTNLTSINIPSSVSAIGASAFFNCSKLTSIAFPSSLVTIGNNAFSGLNSSSLFSIYTKTTTPFDLSKSSGVFGAINKNTCILYVPVGSVAAYRAAVVWQDFFNIVESPTAVPVLLNTNRKIYSTQSAIIVEGTSIGETVAVYSLNGLQLREIKSEGEKVTIPLALKGIYLLKINNDEGMVLKKLVKN
ncbi:MAG: leucine-rich repeat domain-containing protein [Paludibacter sp.]|jgi:BspA type Leucine rich repeat region (6 copies)